MKSNKNLIMSSFFMFAISLVCLMTASYAWFSMAGSVEGHSPEFSASAPENLQISSDGENWASSISVSLGNASELQINPASSYTGIDGKIFYTEKVNDEVSDDNTEFEVARNNVTKEKEGYYLDVPLWIRTTGDKEVKIALDVEDTQNTFAKDLDKDGNVTENKEIAKAVRIGFINPNKDKNALNTDIPLVYNANGDFNGKVISSSDGRNGKLIELLSEPVTDGPHTTPQLVSEGIPFISASAVHEGKIHLEDAQGFITKEFDAECSKKYKPKKWDVYMVKSGSTTGKVAIVDIDDDFNIWSPLAAMRTNNEITSRYLYHLLQTKEIQEQVQNRMSHGSQPNLSMRVLEQFDVKIPTLKEQERIVNVLDKFDALVNDITVGIPAEIELRRQQYDYYRNKLLNFEELKAN